MAKKNKWLDKSPLNVFWFILYIIGNIFTLGSFWFLRNLITYSIEKSK
tara:strand:+ start:57 stop:200 length:144 start_codon:yes stop_codon:yes gene_type:complete